ncbi:CHAT domain-containing protein [Scytonema sp. UIC 10036]|uniref:CHAT domain-containing tetratricopeptide repeat protein n=1 Tax=Scytonema sp. UIC 10036 TaxID=2304196 RepID=UPI0012DA45A5|nr:CHAT domain-containing protein [Scytonema sp. UIC 10036]MUG92922.1 CHAT domain-containing protein [Scytonema sp. UIC 10036]
MNQERKQVYYNLIEALLKCRKNEDISRILETNQHLFDLDFVKTILQVAANLKAQKNIENFKYLIKITFHLLVTIGNRFLEQQNLANAREYYEQSLTIVKQIETDTVRFKLQVDILNILGHSYNRPYDWNLDKAIEVCEKSLRIAKDIGYRHGEAVALLCIGKAYYWYPGKQRNFSMAIKCYEQAKAIFQERNNLQGVLDALYHLQDSYYYTSNYAKAIQSNEERLAIARDLKDLLLEASALFCLGNNYQGLGNLERETAKNYYEQSLAIAKKITDNYYACWLQVRTLQGLGSYYRVKGYLGDAEKNYQESLRIAKNIREEQGQANALQALAEIYYYQGNLARAWNYNEHSLEIKQRLQDQIGTGNSIGFRGSICLIRGQYCEALNYFEQSLTIMEEFNNTSGKASTLTDMGVAYLGLNQIEQAETKLRQGIELWESVRGRLGDRDDFKVSIFEQQARTYHLLQAALIDQEKPLAALKIAERDRARALVELLGKELEGQLAEKTEITSPTLQQIQQIAKEQNATLVEYSILWARTLLIWVVKPTGEIAFRQVDLKPLLQEFNKSLEKLVAIAHHSIGVRGTRFVGLDGDNNDNELIQGNNKQLQQLYQILIEPIAELLPKDADERIIFIPQNSLFLVPFPALLDASGKHLIEQHTILTAPSIQVLELTRQHQQRVQEMGLQDVLVVGNPTMPPFKSHQLIPLPGAEKEAREIAPLLNTKALIGAEATKVAIVQRMPTARIIHLATHGLLNDAEELKVPGAIALAPSGTDDGWLKATEIMDLKMLKAELVVLSVCNTGQGRLTGDGAFGLSRSFISKGVPSVIASLWSVPDALTASFMVELYQNLQQGLDKAQALRQAMLTIKEKHPNPLNWAAFTLIGEASQAIFQKITQVV